MTGNDLIEGALRLIGAIAQGETPSSDEINDAQSALNDMIDSWSNEELIVYATTEETFTSFVVGTQSYTMGTGGSFNTARPQRIYNAALRTTNGTTTYDLPIEILNDDQWAAIGVKTVQSGIPTKMYVVYGFPLVTLKFWPIPNDTSKTLVLWSWKAMSQVTSLTATLSLPPGYQKALRYNLALELAPEYNITPSELVMAQAAESKAAIKRMNSQPSYMLCDAGTLPERSTFNYLTGE